MKIGLVNSNRRGVKEHDVPPVPPIGLDYLADDLLERGHEVSLLDLFFINECDEKDAISDFVANKDLIGITFRNIGVDNYWLNEEQFFVPELARIVAQVKATTSSPVVVGGQGFSIYPKTTLELVGADFGVAGPGERAFCSLAKSPNSYPRGSILSERSNLDIVHKRTLINYGSYIDRGGIPAIQTKIGCPLPCSFCVEAKKSLQLRSLDSVLAEIRILRKKKDGIPFLLRKQNLIIIFDMRLNSVTDC